MTAAPPSSRAQVKRLPDRAAYDRATVDAILDEGFICHVAFATDGQPVVIPTVYGRLGDILYLHGSSASRMLRTLGQGVEACVTFRLCVSGHRADLSRCRTCLDPAKS